MELVLLFGIGKLPKRTLVVGNKIYINYFPHSIAHHMDRILKVFDHTFHFRYAASNIDSVSGTSYCHCQEDDADLSGIRGRWSSSPGQLVRVDSFYRHYVQDRQSGGLVRILRPEGPPSLDLNFSGTWVIINQDSLERGHTRSVVLPDSYYFARHALRRHYDYEYYHPDYLNIYQQMARKKIPLTIYDVSARYGPDLRIIKLQDGTMYAEYERAYIYKLRRL